MCIINQDRDEIYEVSMLATKRHYYNEQMMGFNLYGYTEEGEEVLLGSFDDGKEAFDEMIRLNADENFIKYVTIY